MNSIAFATARQVANATFRRANVRPMTDALDQEARRRRFRELVASQFGDNKADAGRALGYKDGAFVRQLLEGERPITEKTIARIEGVLGGRFAGWFTQKARPATADLRTVSDEEWQLILDYRDAPQSERESTRARLHELAEAIRAGVRAHLARHWPPSS